MIPVTRADPAEQARRSIDALGIRGELVGARASRTDEAHIITDRTRRFIEVIREARGFATTLCHSSRG